MYCTAKLFVIMLSSVYNVIYSQVIRYHDRLSIIIYIVLSSYSLSCVAQYIRYILYCQAVTKFSFVYNDMYRIIKFNMYVLKFCTRKRRFLVLKFKFKCCNAGFSVYVL